MCGCGSSALFALYSHARFSGADVEMVWDGAFDETVAPATETPESTVLLLWIAILEHGGEERSAQHRVGSGGGTAVQLPLPSVADPLPRPKSSFSQRFDGQVRSAPPTPPLSRGGAAHPMSAHITAHSSQLTAHTLITNH